MKKTFKILALVLSLALIVTAFAACGKNTGKEPSTEDASSPVANAEIKLATDGVLTMATNAAFPPYEYLEGDKIVGIDAEIADLIAKKLGLTLKIEDVEFGSIVGGVESGKFDIGMAGMTVTEDRLKSVDFSTSYATGVQVVIVKDGSSITKLEDIKADGSMKIGVQADTTGDIYSSSSVEDGGYGEENVVRFKTGADAVQALVSGKVNCVIIDQEPAKSFVKANTGLSILATEYITEDYAISIAKNNSALTSAINAALAELIADGSVKAIVDKYIPAE